MTKSNNELIEEYATLPKIMDALLNSVAAKEKDIEYLIHEAYMHGMGYGYGHGYKDAKENKKSMLEKMHENKKIDGSVNDGYYINF